MVSHHSSNFCLLSNCLVINLISLPFMPFFFCFHGGDLCEIALDFLSNVEVPVKVVICIRADAELKV